jgi:putative transcription factor
MCDMCSSPDKTHKIELEGSILNVCKNCASYGKVIKTYSKPVKQKKKTTTEEKAPVKETETIQRTVKNYHTLIKNAREQMGLKQEELAKKLAEKESIIHKLESKSIRPSRELARKLEKFLKIKLVEELEMKPGQFKKEKSTNKALTIGDLIKFKK